mmetsp:Transcript_12376/g.16231  ORF Transcript_12376/g.16231 Transcript_12376/m.16231 type:complete len:256 (+) Transcript_12376:290-1057(+)|eukprot:CAMPEP_0198153282 /NCGR_PEP_ID=MMETSP1443-20131203/63418_1 /TAXON_ID=186043 /ORGANISM="Entomoneis sp., Strain CCMP2396" /LENGTH=255 /DNA_ID=CAMNT_0043819557 /DNA_START=210 /DNA_END=977 /DNA_ORIENTATION=+
MITNILNLIFLSCTIFLLQTVLVASLLLPGPHIYNYHHQVKSTRHVVGHASLSLHLSAEGGVDEEEQNDIKNGSAVTATTAADTSFTVNVAYGEGNGRQPQREVNIPVSQGETILVALERASASGLTLGIIPPPPSDCRRGNCLTCSARHTTHSQVDNLQDVKDGNGLSPHMADTIAGEGYVLTCSSTIAGPGVSLKIGTNKQLWDYVYRERFETEDAQTTAHAAMAKAIRRSAERNVDEWADQTEKAYKKSRAD